MCNAYEDVSGAFTVHHADQLCAVLWRMKPIQFDHIVR